MSGTRTTHTRDIIQRMIGRMASVRVPGGWDADVQVAGTILGGMNKTERVVACALIVFSAACFGSAHGQTSLSPNRVMEYVNLLGFGALAGCVGAIYSGLSEAAKGEIEAAVLIATCLYSTVLLGVLVDGMEPDKS